MAVNSDKTGQWKADIAKSVDMYNTWFLKFAPPAFRKTRVATTKAVEESLKATANLTHIPLSLLRTQPAILPTLRMSTCPPLAVDRLIGLAGVSKNLVKAMEKDKRIPPKMGLATLDRDLAKMAAILQRLVDPDIFVWIGRPEPPTVQEVHRAATIVADRLCGSVANPIIKNEQEKRQLAMIQTWLEARGYKHSVGTRFDQMEPGTFSFRTNVSVRKGDTEETVNIPIDAVIQPKTAKRGALPLFFEAKSAGDFTNTNKRRKEEAVKMAQLRARYGKGVRFNLFLCGYFDGGYLGYEAAEGIDWVWEHRIDDMALFGV